MLPPSLPSRRRLKRVAPFQAGKVLALLYGAMGLLIAPLFLIVGLLSPNMPAQQRAGMMFMTGGFAVFLPVLYAGMGFVTGVLGSAFYNLVAKWVGGIEVDVE